MPGPNPIEPCLNISVPCLHPPLSPKLPRFGELSIGEFLYDKFGLMWGVHDSERTDRIRPDFVIHNDASVEQLHADLDEAMALHFKRLQQTSFAGSKAAANAAVGFALSSVAGL